MVEKGIVSFIKLKLEHDVKPEEIKQILFRAGFSEDEIVQGFNEVKKVHKIMHQDYVAQNDFLPHLNKDDRSVKRQGVGYNKKTPSVKKEKSERTEVYDRGGKGLFKGRLRRKDFILGFLFFFGVGYVTLSFGALALSALFPETWQIISDAIKNDQNGFLMTAIPFILAPITVMMLSMITRRLHNLDLPGNLSWLFLAVFMPTSLLEKQPSLIAIYIAMLVLFILMISKKGHPEPNYHGPHPESTGSFFRRIFNI